MFFAGDDQDQDEDEDDYDEDDDDDDDDDDDYYYYVNMLLYMQTIYQDFAYTYVQDIIQQCNYHVITGPSAK